MRVDLSSCAITQGVGAGELAAVWEDPDYNPAYLRRQDHSAARLVIADLAGAYLQLVGAAAVRCTGI